MRKVESLLVIVSGILVMTISGITILGNIIDLPELMNKSGMELTTALCLFVTGNSLVILGVRRNRR